MKNTKKISKKKKTEIISFGYQGRIIRVERKIENNKRKQL